MFHEYSEILPLNISLSPLRVYWVSFGVNDVTERIFWYFIYYKYIYIYFPSPVELHYCTGAYRISPTDVNSRPSSCLTNFLLNGTQEYCVGLKTHSFTYCL